MRPVAGWVCLWLRWVGGSLPCRILGQALAPDSGQTRGLSPEIDAGWPPPHALGGGSRKAEESLASVGMGASPDGSSLTHTDVHTFYLVYPTATQSLACAMTRPPPEPQGAFSPPASRVTGRLVRGGGLPGRPRPRILAHSRWHRRGPQPASATVRGSAPIFLL